MGPSLLPDMGQGAGSGPTVQASPSGRSRRDDGASRGSMAARRRRRGELEQRGGAAVMNRAEDARRGGAEGTRHYRTAGVRHSAQEHNGACAETWTSCSTAARHDADF